MPQTSDEDGEPRVTIQCTACETTSRVPLSTLADSLERHNDRLHDGEPIAELDPDVADHFADLLVEELGLLEDDG